MSKARAVLILTGFMTLTLPLMPVQALLLRVSPKHARRFPHWYHRKVCRLLGVRIAVEGEVVRNRPVLLVSNHTSWLDIPVLSAVAPVSFVAKREVGSWPFISSLARLQRTVFVDRQRKSAAGETANEIVDRLHLGDAIVLFAEGTSSDGNRVYPFGSTLFAAAKPPEKVLSAAPAGTQVQAVSIVYTHLHGLPLGRFDRPLVGWYGDMEMTSHAWELLKAGPLDVKIRVGPPMPLEHFANRKELAARSEAAVREHVVKILRGLPAHEEIVIAAPQQDTKAPAIPRLQSGKWR